MDADEALRAVEGAVATDHEARTLRAVEEYMTVLDGEPATSAEVYSQSGWQYDVDIATGTCTCPDHQHRGIECKHLRRTKLVAGRAPDRWATLQADLGATIRGIDEEIQRLECRKRELERARRTLERLVERVEDLQPSSASPSKVASQKREDAIHPSALATIDGRPGYVASPRYASRSGMCTGLSEAT